MRDPAQELAELDEQGLRRKLRRLESPQGVRIQLDDGKIYHNFSSNDYLGFADSDFLKEAYCRNVKVQGAGSGASRLVCGTMGAHAVLEKKLAHFKNTEAALTFATGFATATGAIPAICGKKDFIILDKLCHASLIDGARLSGATMRVFPHNDTEALAKHLRWAERRAGNGARILVVTESVFSMDGDRAPLKEICGITKSSPALLFVDEAHAFGIVGNQGRGLVASLGLEREVDFQMGTFSKALGLSGGYICARRDWIDLLVNRARSFVYSTAPSPALAATISDALDLVSSEVGEEARRRLESNLAKLSRPTESAIVPVVIGENEAALAASERLRERGFLVPAIRFPTVPRGTSRLRITLSAAHDTAQIESLESALAETL